MGMVWVLSAPTQGSILQTGDSPAFAPELCFEAGEAVAAFRRRLQAISDSGLALDDERECEIDLFSRARPERATKT